MSKSAKTYGVVPPEVLKSYDGLSFLKAIIAGELPNPPISDTASSGATITSQPKVSPI